MKNTFKYLLLLGAAALGFMACQQEEEADIQGVVGDFVYLVDGTEAEYAGPTCEIFHTPIGELGEIKTTVTVALTRVQTSDVEVLLALDNESLSNNYEPFPAGVVKFQEKVTIPAGEKEKSIEVTVDNADFASLTEMNYQAIIRIATATVVKISSNSNAAYLMAVTETIDPADNVVSMPGAVYEYEIKHYSDGDVTADINRELTVSGTEAAFLPFDVVLSVDNDLVASYNEAKGTNYLPVPEDVTVNIGAATMEKDATELTLSVSVSEDNQLKLTADEGYIIPVVITSVGDATLSADSGVVYFVINVRNFETSMNFFQSLYVGDPNIASWYNFSNQLELPSFTFVVHTLIEEMPKYSAAVSRLANSNESWNVRLQYYMNDDTDPDDDQSKPNLRFWLGPNDANGVGTKKFLWGPDVEYNTWYQYAVTFDPNAEESHWKVYFEGELVDKLTLTEDELAAMKKNPLKLAKMEFGASWSYEPNDNVYMGRLMHVGIFNRALSSEWLKQYCYRTEWHPYLIGYASNGLCAYWPMNEGYGHVLNEATGRYESIDFSNMNRDAAGDGKYVAVDASPYVQWKSDALNNFDEE